MTTNVGFATAQDWVVTVEPDGIHMSRHYGGLGEDYSLVIPKKLTEPVTMDGYRFWRSGNLTEAQRKQNRNFEIYMGQTYPTDQFGEGAKSKKFNSVKEFLDRATAVARKANVEAVADTTTDKTLFTLNGTPVVRNGYDNSLTATFPDLGGNPPEKEFSKSETGEILYDGSSITDWSKFNPGAEAEVARRFKEATDNLGEKYKGIFSTDKHELPGSSWSGGLTGSNSDLSWFANPAGGIALRSEGDRNTEYYKVGDNFVVVRHPDPSSKGGYTLSEKSITPKSDPQAYAALMRAYNRAESENRQITASTNEGTQLAPILAKYDLVNPVALSLAGHDGLYGYNDLATNSLGNMYGLDASKIPLTALPKGVDPHGFYRQMPDGSVRKVSDLYTSDAGVLVTGDELNGTKKLLTNLTDSAKIMESNAALTAALRDKLEDDGPVRRTTDGSIRLYKEKDTGAQVPQLVYQTNEPIMNEAHNRSLYPKDTRFRDLGDGYYAFQRPDMKAGDQWLPVVGDQAMPAVRNAVENAKAEVLVKERINNSTPIPPSQTVYNGTLEHLGNPKNPKQTIDTFTLSADIPNSVAGQPPLFKAGDKLVEMDGKYYTHQGPRGYAPVTDDASQDAARKAFTTGRDLVALQARLDEAVNGANANVGSLVSFSGNSGDPALLSGVKGTYQDLGEGFKQFTVTDQAKTDLKNDRTYLVDKNNNVYWRPASATLATDFQPVEDPKEKQAAIVNSKAAEVRATGPTAEGSFNYGPNRIGVTYQKFGDGTAGFTLSNDVPNTDLKAGGSYTVQGTNIVGPDGKPVKNVPGGFQNKTIADDIRQRGEKEAKSTATATVGQQNTFDDTGVTARFQQNGDKSTLTLPAGTQSVEVNINGAATKVDLGAAGKVTTYTRDASGNYEKRVAGDPGIVPITPEEKTGLDKVFGTMLGKTALASYGDTATTAGEFIHGRINHNNTKGGPANHDGFIVVPDKQSPNGRKVHILLSASEDAARHAEAATKSKKGSIEAGVYDVTLELGTDNQWHITNEQHVSDPDHPSANTSIAGNKGEQWLVQRELGEALGMIKTGQGVVKGTSYKAMDFLKDKTITANTNHGFNGNTNVSLPANTFQPH
jgi:hypothetical protein